jgi:hypothetical protein
MDKAIVEPAVEALAALNGPRRHEEESLPQRVNAPDTKRSEREAACGRHTAPGAATWVMERRFTHRSVARPSCAGGLARREVTEAITWHLPKESFGRH